MIHNSNGENEELWPFGYSSLSGGFEYSKAQLLKQTLIIKELSIMALLCPLCIVFTTRFDYKGHAHSVLKGKVLSLLGSSLINL